MISVFEITADGHARGDASDFDIQGFDEAGEIERRCFSFDVWIGGQNHFLDLPPFCTN